MEYGGWFPKIKSKWEKEFNKLCYKDFEELGIEEDKLYSIMEKLYDWHVID